MQPIHKAFDRRRRQSGELRPRLSDHPLRKRRSCRDGSGAAPRLVARFRNPAILKTRGKAHHVATGGIGDFDGHRRWLQAAHVARIAEVIECAFRVHAVLQLSLMIVVAAVIERNGQILICQRKPGGRHPLKWEFPGGKVEAGEDPTAALKRELTEELGVDAEIGVEMARYDFRYGEGPVIHLLFYRVTKYHGEACNLDFAQTIWVRREQLPGYDFLEGDIAFVKELVSQENPECSA